MKIAQSRNKREGKYAGRRRGQTHAREGWGKNWRQPLKFKDEVAE